MSGMQRYIIEVLVTKEYYYDAWDLDEASKSAKDFAHHEKVTLRSVKTEEQSTKDKATRSGTFNPEARPPTKVA